MMTLESVGYLLTKGGDTVEIVLLPTQSRDGFKCVLKDSDWWDVYKLIRHEDGQIEDDLVATAQTEALAEKIGLLLI